MEIGPDYAQGLEAVARGLEAAARGAEQHNEQQRIMMSTWEQQLRTNMVISKGETMGDCPKMVKSQTLESWGEEVKMWSRQYPESELSSLKYLNFVNSSIESEKGEMKKFLEVSVVENREFPKTEPDSVEKIVDLVIKTLGKSSLESASEAWKGFIELKQAKDESIRDYILRFELLEANVQNAKLPIPSTALVMQLLMSSNLSSMSKENVLAKVDMDNLADLHLNVKKTMRELKSLANTDVKKVDSVKLISEDKVEVEVKSSKRMDDKKNNYSKRYSESSRRMEDESRKRDEKRWREDNYLPAGWKIKIAAFLP